VLMPWDLDPHQLAKEIRALPASVKAINLRIDTPGGDVFATRTLQSAIADSSATINVFIDGLAASAGSWFALSSKNIEIVPGGYVMIHRTATFLDLFGVVNAGDIDGFVAELSKEKTRLENFDADVAREYMPRMGLTDAEILDLMSAETWYNAEQALAAGLVDRIADSGDAVSNKFDSAFFNNAPEAYLKPPTPTAGPPAAEEPAGEPSVVVDTAALLRQLAVKCVTY
jgi:ATP-dependent Clp protease protease subunit